MKTVVITGCSRGIGRKFAEVYVKAGWNVIATARNVAAISDIPAQSKHALDVSSEDSIAAFAAAIGSTLPVHLLINNAGTLPEPKPFLNITKRELVEAFETNSAGPFLLTKALFENLKKAADPKSHLSVVANLSSILASVEKNTTGSYHACRAAKSANNSLAKSLSFDLKPHGVSVLQFHPGYVKTDMSPQGIVSPQKSVDGMAAVIDRASADLQLSMTGQFFDFQGKKLPW
ncbi:hypothetical protein HDU82_008067 [Entophlyctis luteolus]|nr:hypothetical protein HDU82_008067 [Entophlyctis luteolus]